MARQKEGSSGLEWRLTVSEGSSEQLVPETGRIRGLWLWVLSLIGALKALVIGFLKKVWMVGADDPRRVSHAFKVGTSLSLVSLFYYVRPLYEGVGGNAMWAVMTVVVVFEYSAGATLLKGFNRGMATFLSASLALGIHCVASQYGDETKSAVLAVAVFLTASAATFSRFLPAVKRNFDYGVTIFILTFSLVSVSSFRVDKLIEMAHQRLSTIAIGGSMCMIISLLVFPVWAGEDLHLLITRNMEKLADSLQGSVAEYFNVGESDSGDDEPCQKSQGYKCVLNSKTTEESLANFARWEPAHGNFGFRHPWKQYLKIGTAMRYCACCIEALNSSISSEVQSPDFIKKRLSNSCSKLASHSSNVLKELAKTTKTMTKSSTIDLSASEMNSAMEDLRNALKSLPDQSMPPPPPPPPPAPPAEAKEEKNQTISTSVPLLEILPLATIASLLLEIATRVEGIVNAVEELADLANFKPASDEKKTQNQATSKPNTRSQGQEAVKTMQMV